MYFAYNLTNKPPPPSELPLNTSRQPTVSSGRAGTGNPGASFQVTGQPPTMAWHDRHPEIFARPDAQGIPGPLWELVDAAVDYAGSDDLRVVIHFRKIRSL